MIDLEPESLVEVQQILLEHVPDCEVRVYGSRVSGKAKRFSDLDLAIVGKEMLGLRQISRLKEAFSESNLPIMVGVQDWNQISDNFQNIIEQHYEVL
ncbi:MAG: nucleotidyltransferase domain-containing protein [SAR324 cluster bacterium]|jgi:predicted nucleotidyltransferase|nr:nucleotidyltransferase domain-containing protein [SAR324 cluster bacterium]